MKVPNYQNANVSQRKLVGYLLSISHPHGRHKEAFFRSFGFSPEAWEGLAQALMKHAAEHDLVKIEDSPFGKRYIIEGGLETPDGRSPLVRAVWFIETDESAPRFVTAYPLGRVEMLQETDIAVLTVDLPEHGLKAGDVGTVVLVHGRGGYEVEFTTLDGETVAVTSLNAAQVRPIAHREIAHARTIEAAGR